MTVDARAGVSACPMAIAALPWKDSTVIESNSKNRKNRRIILRWYRKSRTCIKARLSAVRTSGLTKNQRIDFNKLPSDLQEAFKPYFEAAK